MAGVKCFVYQNVLIHFYFQVFLIGLSSTLHLVENVESQLYDQLWKNRNIRERIYHNRFPPQNPHTVVTRRPLPKTYFPIPDLGIYFAPFAFLNPGMIIGKCSCLNNYFQEETHQMDSQFLPKSGPIEKGRREETEEEKHNLINILSTYK